MLYKEWKNDIKLHDDYSSIVSQAKYKSIHAERLKILNPKQMLQRFSIALA